MAKTKYEIVRDALIKAGIEFSEDCTHDENDLINGHVIMPYEPIFIFKEITNYDKILNQ